MRYSPVHHFFASPDDDDDDDDGGGLLDLDSSHITQLAKGPPAMFCLLK